MKRTRIKICGISSVEAALAAADAGADAVGFVFAPGSPRQVDVQTAGSIIAALPAFVEPIALFADADASAIRAIAAQLSLRTVQLHGKETPEDVQALAPLRVIKALPFGGQASSQDWTLWRTACANICGLLVDTPPPAGSAITGGHGQSFDWNAMAQVQGHHSVALFPPMILAGGLTPRNVAQAIRTVEPYAVDVSSGVESSRGIKDLQKIRDFCAAVRRADAQ